MRIVIILYYIVREHYIAVADKTVAESIVSYGKSRGTYRVPPVYNIIYRGDDDDIILLLL